MKVESSILILNPFCDVYPLGAYDVADFCLCLQCDAFYDP